MRTPRTSVALTALAVVLTLATAGCGSDSGGKASGDALKGKTFTVGSKEFTEQKILGQIAILALEDAGAKVKDQTGITGTANVRTALKSHEIDMYWEYTGTGWSDILKNKSGDAAKDPEQLFSDVAKQDKEKNGISWIAKSTANDTYAFATSAKASKKYDVTTLSDYAKLANDDPGSATMCAAAEFLDRQDGWPGMEKAYGFDLPSKQTSEVDLGLVFEGVPKGKPCNFGEVFETDGRIPANKLVVLKDDKNYFVSYEVAMTVDEKVLKGAPKLEGVLDPVAKALTTKELTKLNSQVDVDGLPIKAVAKKWLQGKDLIG